MELSKEAIEDFKEAYKKDFGKIISDDEAREMGTRLLRFVRLIMRPIPERQKDALRKITQEYEEFMKNKG